eukprot:Skav232780  [mRNA]  locus=scaffold614:163742:165231:- [translate_table: standard]
MALNSLPDCPGIERFKWEPIAEPLVLGTRRRASFRLHPGDASSPSTLRSDLLEVEKQIVLLEHRVAQITEAFEGTAGQGTISSSGFKTGLPWVTWVWFQDVNGCQQTSMDVTACQRFPVALRQGDNNRIVALGEQTKRLEEGWRLPEETSTDEAVIFDMTRFARHAGRARDP